jgi:type III pantothenate kinase
MNALLIDIGNSRIKWRMVDPGQSDAVDREDALDSAWGGTGGALALEEIDRLAMQWRASVVGPVDAAWLSNVSSPESGEIVERALIAIWPGIRVERVIPTPVRGGIVNGYADPQKLGPDRWLAMIGGHGLVDDRSLLVCSFGTATTIDLLAMTDGLPGGRFSFVGGLILPGVAAMRRALVERTARLPDHPGRFVDFADNTDDAITSGVLSSQLGAIERAWRDAIARVPANPGLLCLVAGGAASTVTASLDEIGIPFRAVPDLVLRGLAVLAREPGAGGPPASAFDPLQ